MRSGSGMNFDCNDKSKIIQKYDPKKIRIYFIQAVKQPQNYELNLPVAPVCHFM